MTTGLDLVVEVVSERRPARPEGKGLVIDYQSHLNRMLERTGKDGTSFVVTLPVEAEEASSAEH